MENGGGFVFIVLVFGVPPLLLLVSALVPGTVERARAVMGARPGRSFLLGLLNFLFFLALGWLINVEPIALVGVISLFILLVLLLAGLLVAAGLAGQEVLSRVASRSGTPLGSLLLGLLLLYLSLLVFPVGWFLFLGLVLTGLGAAIFALVQREQPQPEPAPPVAESAESSGPAS